MKLIKEKTFFPPCPYKLSELNWQVQRSDEGQSQVSRRRSRGELAGAGTELVARRVAVRGTKLSFSRPPHRAPP